MSTIKGDHYPACATWFGEECDCDAWKEAPVRDIREAMHPAPFVTADKFLSEDARRRALAYVPSEPLTPEIGFHFGEADASGVAMSPDCTHMLTRGSLVATLPDGSRVNLPAGTVLREQGLAEQVRAGTLGVGMADDPAKLRGAFTREHSPDVVLTQARGLLQRARVPLAETGAADVLADVDAFLAGAVLTRGSLVALVLLMARILRESFAEGRTVKETVADITEDMNAGIDLAFPELARHLAPSPK